MTPMLARDRRRAHRASKDDDNGDEDEAEAESEGTMLEIREPIEMEEYMELVTVISHVSPGASAVSFRHVSRNHEFDSSPSSLLPFLPFLADSRVSATSASPRKQKAPANRTDVSGRTWNPPWNSPLRPSIVRTIPFFFFFYHDFDEREFFRSSKSRIS